MHKLTFDLTFCVFWLLSFSPFFFPFSPLPFLVVGIKHRFSCMWGKHSITKLHPSPYLFFMLYNYKFPGDYSVHFITRTREWLFLAPEKQNIKSLIDCQIPWSFATFALVTYYLNLALVIKSNCHQVSVSSWSGVAHLLDFPEGRATFPSYQVPPACMSFVLVYFVSSQL